jgi:hypothetical protein
MMLADSELAAIITPVERGDAPAPSHPASAPHPSVFVEPPRQTAHAVKLPRTGGR